MRLEAAGSILTQGSDQRIDAAGGVAVLRSAGDMLLVASGTAGVTGANVFFEDGPNVLSFDDTLKNNGSATNVELVLKTRDGNAIDLVSLGGIQYTRFSNNVTGSPSSPGAGRLDFSVAYMATGVVTPGTVQSSITYSMVYN
jgi:major type 1 subunit fimbrin (pilin)